MRTCCSLAIVAVLVGINPASAGGEGQGGGPKSGLRAPSAMEMVQGEVRKVEAQSTKLTLRHAEIKSLGMPAMTMVFQVADKTMLNGLKVGDKVRFMAERRGGALVVTHIENAG